MPSGCRSGAIVLLLSKQLHILETPAPTLFLQLHLGTLESTYTAKQGALPGSFSASRLEGLQGQQN